MAFLKTIKKGIRYIQTYIDNNELGIKFGINKFSTNTDNKPRWNGTAMGMEVHSHVIEDITDFEELNIDDLIDNLKALEDLLILESGTWIPTEPTIRNVANCRFSRVLNLIVLSGSFGFTTSSNKVVNGIPRIPKYSVTFMMSSDNDFNSVSTLTGTTLTIQNARHNGIYHFYVMYEPI